MTPNSAVRCLSARVSAAVNPANIATFPIGSIVVQRVAKSLLILIRSGDIFSVCGNHRQPCNLSSAFQLLVTARPQYFLPFYPLLGSARVPRAGLRVPRKRTFNDLTSGL